MSFGIYVHIPYCVQRCPYCDFATYEQSRIPKPEKYIELLKTEILSRHARIPYRELDTVYFGGGTPSLLDPELLQKILRHFSSLGFKISSNTEMTLEINPATVTPDKLKSYLKAGFNRFSVGAQTFDDDLLKRIGRKHTAQDTKVTLDILAAANVSVSLDLLFALPGQTKAMLSEDLQVYLSLKPDHISPYCLTVPESNPLAAGRPLEDDQVEMFEIISRNLEAAGYQQYEISNYCQPGRESRHNWLYWNDDPWWGVGLSAHSYIKDSTWGSRFWNAKTYDEYASQVHLELLPDGQIENLQLHQALTDFCHTFLRTARGLPVDRLKEKFPDSMCRLVEKRLNAQSLVTFDNHAWRLTKEGILLSNKVFEDMTFLPQDLR